MDIAKLKSLLQSSSEKFIDGQSFSQRIDIVRDIIDNEYPKIPINLALNGSVIYMEKFMEREKIETLLKVLKHSSQENREYIIDDSELNEILQLVYRFVNQNSLLNS